MTLSHRCHRDLDPFWAKEEQINLKNYTIKERSHDENHIMERKRTQTCNG